MRFDPPLIPGILVRRYKRFLADVDQVTAALELAQYGTLGGGTR